MKTTRVFPVKVVSFLFAFVQVICSPLLCCADSTNCIPAPTGLLSWWRSEGDGVDVVGGNNGALAGNAAFASGEVGQAFIFDGDQDGVEIGTATNLQLQDFSIETWVKRASDSTVSLNGNGSGMIFALGAGGEGLGFWIQFDNHLTLGKLQVNQVSSGAQVADLNWHHVAVTKLGTNVVFYVDGVAYPASAYNSGGYTFSQLGYLGAWLNPSAQLDNSFYGMIDELAIYNRKLTAAEIQAIYQAGILGKCVGPTAPVIIVQPTDQTILVGESAIFGIEALGTQPLAYQWFVNDTNLSNATSSMLIITNAQLTDAGNYTVTVTNLYGSATSSIAVLTVNLMPPCVAPPPGILSWWPGNGSTTDIADGNSGTLAGNATFGPGRIGSAFVLDGNRDGVQIGMATNLQLQDFSLETWIKRTSSSVVSFNGNGGGMIFSLGGGGYGLYLSPSGLLTFGRLQVNEMNAGVQITDTNWHHVAVTKLNSNVVFYADGVSYPAPAYDSAGGFTFSVPGYIGAWLNPSAQVDNSFYGMIDELTIYNRELTAAEIQSIYAANVSGKCPLSVPPVIVVHPRSTSVSAGANVTLTVLAGGSEPFGYQWRFNETNIIAGATNSALALTNVQFSHIGNYSVEVTNAAGSALSSNATLTVSFPPAIVRVGNTNAMAGGPVTVPVTLAANGNEHSFGFSLNFSTQRLAFASASLGSGAAGATLFVNTSLMATGRVGIAVVFPSQSNFTAGTQQVVRVTFNALPLLAATPNTNTISFADQPLLRELSDAQLQALSANYSNGTVTLSPSVFESDVWPRTNGNQNVSTTDWLQVGRFVARLDTPATTNEFQRADCAPRATLGDGQMKVTDWVQAGRYVGGLDPFVAIGGPTAETNPTLAGSSPSRQLKVLGSTVMQGQTSTVFVNLEAQGNENAVGFTFAFDPGDLTFSSVALGSDGVGANLMANTTQVASGKLGIVLTLSADGTFSTGTKELVAVSLVASPAASGVFPVTLSDQIATRCISDSFANEVPVTYLDGSVTVRPVNFRPTLVIAQASNGVVLSWPTWAGDFALQMSGGIAGFPGTWTNASGSLQTNGDEISLALPVVGEARFFRLQR